MADEKLFDDIIERELFLQYVSEGTPANLAGLEVGWTPRRTKLNMADPDFAELVNMARSNAIDGVERGLFELATKGKNLGAIQMVLYNLRSDIWKDVRRIEVNQNTTISVGSVLSVVDAAKALLREVGPAALQPGGQLDDIIDADVVEPGAA